jgi:hypothetical protein
LVRRWGLFTRECCAMPHWMVKTPASING